MFPYGAPLTFLKRSVRGHCIYKKRCHDTVFPVPYRLPSHILKDIPGLNAACFHLCQNFTACNRLCIRINDFLPVRLIAIQIPVQINAADMHRKDIARLIGFCQFNPVLRLVRFWRIQQQINYFRRRCNRKIIAVFLFCTPLCSGFPFLCS